MAIYLYMAIARLLPSKMSKLSIVEVETCLFPYRDTIRESEYHVCSATDLELLLNEIDCHPKIASA